MAKTKWLFLLLPFFVGCTFIDVLGADPKGRIENWVAKREYARALRALERIPSDHPQSDELLPLRQRVASLARSYEAEVLAEAERRAEAGRWAAVTTLLDDARHRLPASETLTSATARLNQRRQRRATIIAREIAAEQAQWLSRAIPLYDRLARISPGDETVLSQKRRLLARRERVSASLRAFGIEAREAGELAEANRLLTLAVGLGEPRQETIMALAEVRDEMEHRQQRLERTRERRKEEAVSALLARYHEALEAGRFASARSLMARLRDMAPQDEEIRALNDQLTARLKSETRRLLEEGIANYSAGRFESAMASWNRVLAIVPDHPEATDHLSRARRVVNNLRQLRKKQVEGS